MNNVQLNGFTFHVFHLRTNQRENGIAQNAGEIMRKQWTKILKRQKKIEDRGSKHHPHFKGLFVFYIILSEFAFRKCFRVNA